MRASKPSKDEEKQPPPGRAPNPHSLNLTPDEAMSELRCSKATLFKLLKNGEIDSFLLGPNARRIPRSEIEAYMRRKLSGSSSPTAGEAA